MANSVSGPAYSRAPKRRIEKVFSRLNFLVANAEVDKVLHTCEDAKTLVRTILDVGAISLIANSTTLELVVAIAPNGVDIASASVAESLDQPYNRNIIWRGVHAFQGDADGDNEVTNRLIDIKGMRKLDDGDEIKLYAITSDALDISVYGTATLFFKE